MLVLTRRIGERLKIGDAWVTVVEIHGSNQVRLGIDAPQHVKVTREELAKRDEAAKEKTT